MHNIVLSLMINLVMAGLLLATIIYCLRLNARIRLLQDSKSELARIIREFDECTTRATKSIAEIHAATNRISDNIQHKIDKANFLATDLDYLIEKGSALTGKTEAASRPRPMPVPLAELAVARAPVPPVAASENPAPRRPMSRMRSRAEQEITSILGGKEKIEVGR